MLHLQAAQRALLHVGVEQLVTRLAALLGAVHRRVGVPDHGLGVRLLAARRQRDAQARRQEGLAVVECERGADGGRHPLGDQHGVALTADVAHDRELVAAEARHRVARPDDPAEAVGDVHEQAVAGVVTERVVDHLEPVEVEEQDRDAEGGAPGPRQRLLEAVEEQRAVGQPG